LSRRRSAGLLAFVALFGFMARAATYKSPLLDHHAWRQADTASIARNFLRERFNPFYPQIGQRRGQADGYVETGFELLAFLAATIALAVGFHPEIGRLLSTLCFVGSCLPHISSSGRPSPVSSSSGDGWRVSRRWELWLMATVDLAAAYL
jgi:hypothetical protein